MRRLLTKHVLAAEDPTPSRTNASFINWSCAICAISVLVPIAATAVAQTLPLPPRPASAPTGSQFVSLVGRMSQTERENWVYAQVMSGNVPKFMRNLVPVTVSATINGTPHTGTYYVAPDCLAIGTDQDYFFAPTSPMLAQRICDELGCTLPTRYMVGQIWSASTVRLNPVTINPANYDITSVAAFNLENSSLYSERIADGHPLGALVGGDKKDVVISNIIYSNVSAGVPNPVVIYGWYYPNGTFIQGMVNVHASTYMDYSHGIRLVQNAMTLDGAPDTITNVLTQTNLAALLSDEGANQSTTAGVIHLPRYTIPPVGPAIILHPRAQTVLAGATVNLTSLGCGSAPLTYQWLSNTIPMPLATNSTFTITNAQISNAATYSVFISNSIGIVTSRVASVQINTNLHPALFADNFEINSSPAWNFFWAASNGVPDYTVDWAYDYSAAPYTFNGATAAIPAAPKSLDGSTRAVRFTVNNNDSSQSTAAVNIYPKNQLFSNDFALKFDMWINYPGGIAGAGATGSTEHAICGINHSGTEINWAAPSGSGSDGIWFAVDGEGGTSRDYRSYVGNPAGVPTELTGTASGLVGTDAASPFFQTLFPSTRAETTGAPGKQWVQVEIRQTNNVLLWILDGTVVCQRTNTSTYKTGTIMLGFMDLFPSIANPAQDAFVLFDNIRVEDLSNPPRFVNTSVKPDGTLQMLSSAILGKMCYLESSTNLTDWLPVTSYVPTNTPALFSDPVNRASPARFYRIRQ